MSNSLDPDQARHYVVPDLDPNCLKRLSTDDSSRHRVDNMTNSAGMKILLRFYICNSLVH